MPITDHSQDFESDHVESHEGRGVAWTVLTAVCLAIWAVAITLMIHYL